MKKSKSRRCKLKARRRNLLMTVIVVILLLVLEGILWAKGRTSDAFNSKVITLANTLEESNYNVDEAKHILSKAYPQYDYTIRVDDKNELVISTRRADNSSIIVYKCHF